MTETSWWWDGHATGDSITNTPYDMDQWATIQKMLFTPDPNNQGVIGGTLDSLAITASSASVITVDSGAAIVNGRLYHNDSQVSFNISGAVMYWIVGLLADVNVHTVRAFARGGYADSATALASLAHFTDYWEIPLAIVLTDSTGVIASIDDRRLFVQRPEVSSEFVPVTGGYDTTVPTDLFVADKRGMVMPDAHYVYGYGHFIVPKNFWKLLTVKPIVIPVISGNVYAKTSISYGSFHVNEAYNTRVNSTGFTTTSVIANYANILHVTLPLNDLKSGLGTISDFMSLTTVRNAAEAADTVNNSIYLSGWLVEYAVLF